MVPVDRYVSKLVVDTFPNQLAKLIGEKSVSSVPEFKPMVRSCAELVRDFLKDIGARAYLQETEGNPLVVGEIVSKKDAHTVAIYNHYDVQPCDLAKWDTDPWKLKVENGRYYGRGASDNKGPLLTLIHAVHFACQRDVPLNYLFICEGEEEAGLGSHFIKDIQKIAEAVKPDSVLVPDILWLSERAPAIIYGLRGNLYMHFNLEVAQFDAHSGLAGGPARNALTELMDIVTKCHDPQTGKILIPRFYDNVEEPSEEEIEYWLKSPFDVKSFMQDLGIRKLRFYDRKEVMKSIWTEPTFEVHGCVGGHMEKNGQKTIVPGQAQLLVSTRLVPHQNPEIMFRLTKQFVEELNPDVVVKKTSSSKPYSGKIDSPHIEAMDQAFHSAFGLSPSRVRSGGSIGAVMDMYDAFDQPQMVIAGLSLPTDNIHGPNEHFEKNQVIGGVKAFFNFFKTIAREQ